MPTLSWERSVEWQ